MPASNKQTPNKLGVYETGNFNGNGVYDTGINQANIVYEVMSDLSQYGNVVYTQAAVGSQTVFYPAVTLTYPMQIGVTTNTALTVPSTFTIAGTDKYGRSISENITVTVVGTLVNSIYTYRTIDSVTVVSKTGNPSIDITAGPNLALRFNPNPECPEFGNGTTGSAAGGANCKGAHLLFALLNQDGTGSLIPDGGSLTKVATSNEVMYVSGYAGNPLYTADDLVIVAYAVGTGSLEPSR